MEVVECCGFSDFIGFCELTAEDKMDREELGALLSHVFGGHRVGRAMKLYARQTVSRLVVCSGGWVRNEREILTRKRRRRGSEVEKIRRGG